MSEAVEPFLSGKKTVLENSTSFQQFKDCNEKDVASFIPKIPRERVGHFQGVHLFKTRMLHGSSPRGQEVLSAGPAPQWPSLYCSGHSDGNLFWCRLLIGSQLPPQYIHLQGAAKDS